METDKTEQKNNREEVTNKDLAGLIDGLVLIMKNHVIDKMATKNDLKKEIKGLRDEMVSKFDGVNRRMDDFALNKVSYENFNPLVKRVETLEQT